MQRWGVLEKNKFSLLRISLMTIVLIFVFGCAGLEVAMENSKVSVASNLNKVPFFNSHPGEKVYIKIENFSEYKELNLLNKLVKQKYVQRGFKIVNNSNRADWIIEAKIVNIKKEDFSAREIKDTSSANAGMGGAMVGGIIGAASGDYRHTIAGALIGGVLTGAANLTVNSWVKLGYITIITDIEVKERKNLAADITREKEKSFGKKQGSWINYRFQALTRAKKTNLRWKDCSTSMVQEIARLLGSLL